jgi:hypothetical protein
VSFLEAEGDGAGTHEALGITGSRGLGGVATSHDRTAE